MRALTVIPAVPSSIALTSETPAPNRRSGELLIDSLLVGVCGTDREIIAGSYGQAPAGEERLILGHESLGRVAACDADSPFEVGDLVVGIVRRPDPVPCPCCAAGEWDMCMNGRYTERGIWGAHGYASDQFTLEQDFALKVPTALGDHAVLLEPTSVVAKAWEQVEHIAARSSALRLRNVLVTGAGPVGLLAALLASQRGYNVTVLDLATDGPKPELARSLGARYQSDPLSKLPFAPDIVIECTGNQQLVVDVLSATARNSIVCLAGVSSGARSVELGASKFNNQLVLENDVVFGSVNANRRHYEQALQALGRADPAWLGRMISRKVPLSRYQDAFERCTGEVKVVLDIRA
jgi:threonine dehydrogenase-like Zn-dependent dehydrogenase